MPHCWKSHVTAHIVFNIINWDVATKMNPQSRSRSTVATTLFRLVQVDRFYTCINRGSYMSAHVLLILFSKLGKRDKMRGLQSILSLFSQQV